MGNDSPDAVPDDLARRAAGIAAGFGDGSITLPQGMDRPAYCAAEVLGEAAWDSALAALG